MKKGKEESLPSSSFRPSSFIPHPSGTSPMKPLLVACLLMAAGCKEEATFQGRPTRYWLEQLKSPNATARARAANALTHLGPEAKRAIPDLIKLLDDREPLVRWAAATTLGEFGPASRGAAPALKKL